MKHSLFFSRLFLRVFSLSASRKGKQTETTASVTKFSRAETIHTIFRLVFRFLLLLPALLGENKVTGYKTVGSGKCNIWLPSYAASAWFIVIIVIR